MEIKASDDVEEEVFAGVKRGKFLAFSRMWSNIACSVMTL